MNSPQEDVSDAQLSHEIRLVEKYWETNGTQCGDCEHCKTWEENHGPGLRETMSECRVLTDDMDLSECPAFESLVAEATQKMADDQQGCYGEDRFRD